MNLAPRLVCCCGAASLLATIATADPLEEAKAVFQEFLDLPSYTWEVTDSRGKPEEANAGGDQELKGQHEMGGYTKIYFVSGPHILPRGTISTQPWEGISDDHKFWGDRWVFATPEGWKLLSELPLPFRGGAPPLPTRPGTVPIFSTSQSISLRRFGAWRPDQEIAVVVANLSEIQKLGTDLYRAELTPEGATKLAAPPKMSWVSIPGHAENATGSIKFWVRRGVLIRYELSIEGTLVLALGKRPINFARTRDLTQLGTTVIEVPEEVQRKLGK